MKFEDSIRHIFWKRLFDLLFSLFVLIITFPLLLCISVIIWATNRGCGPIFYQHERVGRGGKLFYCIKFRTMFEDADKRLEALLVSDANMRAEWKQYKKLKNDPRITSIGRFLRRTSLDELPQFFNVLKGDLSVVGPRPVMLEEIKEYYGDYAKDVLSIRPGITGVWQVSDRCGLSYAKRVILDMCYVRHLSFFWDIKLIFKTIPVMLSLKGDF